MYIRIPITVIEKLLLVGKEFLLKKIKMRIMVFRMPSSQDDVKFFYHSLFPPTFNSYIDNSKDLKQNVLFNFPNKDYGIPLDSATIYM